MSFVATLGLLLLTDRIRSLLPRWPLGLDLTLAASLAAQLALAPLLVVHFHRLAPAAIVLNVVAIPLATAVLLSGALLAAGSWLVPAAGPVLGGLAWAAAHGLLLSSRVLDVLPGLDLRAPDPLALVVMLHGLALLLLALGRVRLGLVGTALGLAGLAWGGPAPRADGLLEVTVLDVGQGEAVALRSPGGRHLLVDAGGSFDGRFDVAESVVGPFLWRQRVRQLDLLVLTHAHPDHVGGAAGVLRGFRVGETWEGPAPRADPGYAALDAALRRSGVARRTVARGVVLHWDGVELEVLGPPAPATAPRRTRNDDSVVLRVRYGEVVLLLTGDVEAAGEAALPVGPVSVLKVAHHGSRTSSSAGFLRQTRPRLAVISAGSRNPFGHPSPEVLGRLRAAGTRVFRTDLDGSVRLSTDGCTVRATSERSARDENIRAVMDLRASVDMLRSPACPTYRGGPPLSR
jgi:competence protein ComEC